MKRSSLLLILAFFTSQLLSGQKANDAILADPDHHVVRLENEHFRVIEARASRGAISPMHSHPALVFIGAGTSRVKLGLPDGKTTILDIYPGQVLWFPDGLEHKWELISGELNVIGVEIKSVQKPGAGPLPPVTRRPDDSVSVDPDVHHVLLENDHVRVFDGRASQGRKSPMHSHPPSLLVTLGKGRGKLTMPDGKSFYHDYTPGDVLWAGEGMQHAWEMIAGDPHVIVVEVKSAHRALTQKGD